MSFVFMYFDDFGYASLSYFYVEPDVRGTDFTFSQFLSFFTQIYLGWSGRVVFHGIMVLLLQIDVWAFRIVQSISVLLTFMLLCRFATKGRFNAWTALFACTLYGICSFNMFRKGFYWFSASAIYLLPLTFFFFGFVVLRHLSESTNNIKYKIPLVVLGMISFFLAGVSQEQISMTVMATLFILLVFPYVESKLKYYFKKAKAKSESESESESESKHKKQETNHLLLFFLSSFVGGCLLIFAPGNFRRFLIHSEASHESFLRSVFSNFYDYGRINYTFYQNFIFLAVLAVFVCCIAYVLWKNNKLSKNIFLFTFPFSIFFLTGSYFLKPYISMADRLNLILVFLFYLYCVFMIFLVIKYLLFINDRYLLALFIGALCSQIIIPFYSPYIVERMFIVFYFALFAIYIRLFNDMSKYFSLKTILVVILLPIFMASSLNMAIKTHGYALNRNVNIYNDNHLRQVSADIRAGVEIEQIEILPLFNQFFGYHFGEGTLTWMRYYYDIPQNIPIVFR